MAGQKAETVQRVPVKESKSPALMGEKATRADLDRFKTSLTSVLTEAGVLKEGDELSLEHIIFPHLRASLGKKIDVLYYGELYGGRPQLIASAPHISVYRPEYFDQEKSEVSHTTVISGVHFISSGLYSLLLPEGHSKGDGILFKKSEDLNDPQVKLAKDVYVGPTENGQNIMLIVKRKNDILITDIETPKNYTTLIHPLHRGLMLRRDLPEEITEKVSPSTAQTSILDDMHHAAEYSEIMGEDLTAAEDARPQTIGEGHTDPLDELSKQVYSEIKDFTFDEVIRRLDEHAYTSGLPPQRRDKATKPQEVFKAVEAKKSEAESPLYKAVIKEAQEACKRTGLWQGKDIKSQNLFLVRTKPADGKTISFLKRGRVHTFPILILSDPNEIKGKAGVQNGEVFVSSGLAFNRSQPLLRINLGQVLRTYGDLDLPFPTTTEVRQFFETGRIKGVRKGNEKIFSGIQGDVENVVLLILDEGNIGLAQVNLPHERRNNVVITDWKNLLHNGRLRTS